MNHQSIAMKSWKRLWAVAALLLMIPGVCLQAEEVERKTLNIGDQAPDFSLPGIDGKTHRLTDYKDAKVLMVAFISNHCPTSQATEERIKKLVADYAGKGFQLVAINPNHPDSVRLDELGYSFYNDGFEDMQKHAKEQGFNFPYLYDGETQEAAKAYGCLTTPHVFVFDQERKLQYKGAFDDSRFADPATVKVNGARDAVAALIEGREVVLKETKPHGCSTKWLSKKELAAKVADGDRKVDVEVEFIDAEGVAKLRKNGTNKVRLINVWATWCSSCVEEFPILASAALQFSRRDFEFINISIDEPEDLDAAKAFLSRQLPEPSDKLKKSLAAEGRKTNSYLFKGEDQEAIVKALDPEGWEGLVVPHTLLVAPDGSVIWRHNGEVDGDELRRKIIEYMGRYYTPSNGK